MRKNSRLEFNRQASRKTLTLDEINYWKSFFNKVLKIGFEFEYNLKENNGSCNGKGFVCPCAHPDKERNKCYESCKVYKTCKLRKKVKCPGVWCIEFVSPCQTCKNAVRDCSNCDMFDDPDKRPKNIRQQLTNTLVPTNDLSKLGPHGTMSVIKDGSLSGGGGVEVTTVGRRINYNNFLRQAKIVISECAKRGAYADERTSIHMHLIASYLTLQSMDGGRAIKAICDDNRNRQVIKELEEPVPEIILANMHQLIRRYHNAIVWMTSSGSDKNHMTRWCKFRKSILGFSASRTKMNRILQQLADNDGHRGKYSFMNYTNSTFDSKGNLDRFHVEGRFCDGMLSPTAVASIGMLLYAISMASIRLSQYGVLKSGDSSYMRQASDIEATLLNNDGGWSGARTSNTSRFAVHIETVRKQASELLNLLQPELRKQPQALHALKSLAEKPCSMRIIEGTSWEDIEKDLVMNKRTRKTGELRILNLIDTMYVDDCINPQEWIGTITEEINRLSKRSIEIAVNNLLKTNVISWVPDIGTFVRC